ncbi:capsular biosynthesis protein [Vibrio hannami]
MLNTSHYLTFATVTTLVFCGLAQYVTGITSFFWLPCILALMMVGMQLMQKRYKSRPLDLKEWIVFLLFFSGIGVAMVSTILQGGITVTIIGFKNTFCLSLVMYCLIAGFVNQDQLYRASKVFYAIYYAQFPAILYQIFVIVPQRVAIKGDTEKWDSVVGTFGGEKFNGGNSAALGMFCLFIILLKLSEYKHGVCSKRSLILHACSAFAICILGEIKFVIMLAPFMMAYIWLSSSYLKGMKTYSVKTLLMIDLSSLALVTLAAYILGMVYANTASFYSDPTKSPFMVFWDSIEYVFDPNYIMDGGQIGRMTTVFFWHNHSDLHGIAGRLFGYGLNSTNHGSAMSRGFLDLKFNLELDSTSLGALLWETGFVGAMLYISLIIYVFKITKPIPVLDPNKLCKDEIQFMSMQAAFRAFMIVILCSIPYSQILIHVSGLQYLFYFCMGASLVIRRTVLTNIGK